MKQNNIENLNSPERRDAFSLIGKGVLAAILLVIPGLGKSFIYKKKKINIRLHRNAVARKTGGRR